MTGAEVLDIASQGIWTLIIVSMPMMLVGLIVGVIIALFQALTQIQEMTLVFVPKIIAIFVTMLLTLPFLGATMAGYMDRVVDMIAEAQKPILIGGRGAVHSGAKAEIEAIAEQTGGLVASSLLAKGLFHTNPFSLDIAGAYASDFAREQFAEADLVIGFGVGLGHYTTEALIPIALGIRAAAYPLEFPADFLWTTIGAMLALVIVLNKALNDMVHVARANAGLPKLADTHGETAPRGGLIAKLRRAARFVPFHRLYHSVELTLIAFAAAIVGLFAGQPLVDRIVVGTLLPLAVLALLGHFVAIMASRRVRA